LQSTGCRSASALKPAFLAATIVSALVWPTAAAYVKEVALNRSIEGATGEVLRASSGAPD
jgi:hypothetical protein